MKYIVFSGDSHTCGEGALGFSIQDETELGYNPQGAGVGRNADYTTRSYVNLSREGILRRTESEAVEISASDLAHESNLPMENRCVHLVRPLEMPIGCDGLIIMFALKKEKAVAEILLDDVPAKTVALQTDTPRYGDWSFRYVRVDCTDARKLTVRAAEGDVYVYSVELCSGRWAVVNAGVGSCTAGRFLQNYFDDCVAAFSPEIVVLEAHTINDWIGSENTDEYAESLTALIARVREIGATPVLLTVSPILGNQQINFHAPYEDYVARSIAVAKAENVRLIDAHEAMVKYLDGLNEQEKREKLYHDLWHVNTEGHQIYSEVILPGIAALLK